jgi:hypothetical protein
LLASVDVFCNGSVDRFLLGLEFAESNGFGDQVVVEIEIGSDGTPPLCDILHNKEDHGKRIPRAARCRRNCDNLA